MKATYTTVIRLAVLAIAIFVLAGSVGYAQQVPPRANDKDVNSVLERLKKNSETFRKSLDRALDKSPLDSTKREDNVNEFMKEFSKATKVLEEGFDKKRDVTNEVTEVLNRAVTIDSFVARHNLTEQAKSDWLVVRTDLDTLAKYFNVSWNWDRKSQ
jgi:hypothetical protein